MRLNRYLARAGVASRRNADTLITSGRVRVNGKPVTKLGTLVAEGDRVEVDAETVTPPAAATYLLLNKPDGVVTTMHDPQGRASVGDFVADRPGVIPVGRLDYHTSGVLLLTDDGELAHRLLHPRYGVDKTYRATIAGRLEPGEVRRLIAGLALPETRFAAAKVRVVAVRRDHSIVDLTIHEGRNRQVRRMFEALGHPVLALTRVRFGPLRVGALPPGGMREITDRELTALERHR